MGKVIEFYVPEGFRAKEQQNAPLEISRVIEFPSGKSGEFHQVTWIVPEVARKIIGVALGESMLRHHI